MKNLVAIFLGMLFFAGCGELSDSKDPQQEGNLHVLLGTVNAGGSPIEDAEVTVSDSNKKIVETQTTASDGKFKFLLPGGDEYELRVKASGYSDYTAAVNLKDVDWYKNDVDMERDGDNDDNDDSGSPDIDMSGDQDYSEAYVESYVSGVSVSLESCIRSKKKVTLTYYLTNKSQSSSLGITINNVNTMTEKTRIYDDLANFYYSSQVTISLGGNTYGAGNNIDGELPPNEPVRCSVTVKDVDEAAEYMTFYMYISVAAYGGVNISDNVVLSDVKIH